MRWELAIAMWALGACAGPTTRDGPVGDAVEAVGAKPVIDDPRPLAPREKVPGSASTAALAPRGAGFLLTWVEFSPLVGPNVKAIFLGADGGAPGSPFSLGTGDWMNGAACAPSGECLVLWHAFEPNGVVVTHVTGAGAGAGEPVPIAKASAPTRAFVDYDASAEGGGCAFAPVGRSSSRSETPLLGVVLTALLVVRRARRRLRLARPSHALATMPGPRMNAAPQPPCGAGDALRAASEERSFAATASARARCDSGS